MTLDRPRGMDPAFARLGRAAHALELLYLRPSRFMREVIPALKPPLVRVLALTYAVSEVLSFLSVRRLHGYASPFGTSWGRFWLLILGAGLVNAGVVYFLGGWWYEVRLWLSGVNPIDVRLSRAVYLASSQTVVLPGLLWEIGRALYYATPAAAEAHGTPWALLLLPFPFWSAVASWVGVNILFPGKRALTLIWFLVLPCVGFAFGALLAMATVLE